MTIAKNFSRGMQKYREAEKRTSSRTSSVAATPSSNKNKIKAKPKAATGASANASTLASNNKISVAKSAAKTKLSPTEKAAEKANSSSLAEQADRLIAAKSNAVKAIADKSKAESTIKKGRGNPLVNDEISPVNTHRDRLIVQYGPLIKYIAQRIAARLPANIELDDLISSGVIGLMDAIDKYDASRDNKFKTYAEFRIRGAILDELRAQDWVPRSVREKAKQLERCYSKIEQEKGRQATDDEVCEALGISKSEYHDLLGQVRSVSLLSFDDISNFAKADKKTINGITDGSSRVPTPFSEVNTAALKKLVATAIQDLPEKQRLVLSLYYYEDLNLKEIGRVLDVTESRVSQLHTQAVLRLKGRLRNSWDDFVGLFN